MNQQVFKRIPRPARFASALAAAAALSLTAGAWAQADKSIVVEPVPAFPAFNQWVSNVVVVTAEPQPVSTVQVVQLMLAGAPTEQAYQPLPVIVGLPELPLLRAGGQDATRGWGPAFNYQGLYMRQVVLNERGNRAELHAMGHALKPGQRFKLRLTATFDAVADVDQVLGDPWYGKRTGQVYPKPGLSVQLKAGETVDLPLGANEFFQMNRSTAGRLVVSVRHAKAQGDARSNQPAYRQDDKAGSSYLQLVPAGHYPAIEQLVSLAR